jgi:hypothetical protein
MPHNHMWPTERQLSDDFSPPDHHPWRQTCNSDHQLRQLHRITHPDWVLMPCRKALMVSRCGALRFFRNIGFCMVVVALRDFVSVFQIFALRRWARCRYLVLSPASGFLSIESLHSASLSCMSLSFNLAENSPGNSCSEI